MVEDAICEFEVLFDRLDIVWISGKVKVKNDQCSVEVLLGVI